MSLSRIAFAFLVLAIGSRLVGQEVATVRSLPLKQQSLLTVFPGEVETIRVAPDGKSLCVGWRSDQGVPGGAWLLDGQTFQPRVMLDIGQGGSNSDSDFTSDSRFLVTLSFRSILRIWDTATGKLLGQGSNPSWDWFVRCHPNNQECVSSGGQSQIRRWQIPSGKLIAETDTAFRRVIGMDLSSDGKRLAIMGRRDDSTVFLQIRSYPDLEILSESKTPTGSGTHATVAFSPDGKRLAFTSPGDGTLVVVDTATGKFLKEYPADLTRSNDMGFISNHQVISHGWRRSPRMIDIDSGVVTALTAVVAVGGAGMAWTKDSGEMRLLLGHAGGEKGHLSIWTIPLGVVSGQSKAAAVVSAPDQRTENMPPAESTRQPMDQAGKSAALIAIPTEEAVKKAENEIKQLLQISDDGPIDDSLPDRLLKLAAEEKDTTVHYAMLTTAARLAGRLGNAVQIRRAMDELTKKYQFDRLRVAGRLLYEARTRPLASDAKLQLASLAEELGDEAIAAEEIDYASAFYDLSIEWSPRDRANLRRRREKGKQIDAILPEFRKAVAASKLIEKVPPDPVAHQTWGSYLCFVRGKWEPGLVLLTKAKDTELKELAQSDLAVGDNSQDWLDLGSRWKDFASKQPDGPSKKGATAAARYWYQKAAVKLTGLEKLRAEAALKDLPSAEDHPVRASP